MASQKNSNIIWTALVVSWIIIGVWIRWVFFRGEDRWGNENTDLVENILEERFYIDESVLLDGTITRAEWFEMYTHDFVDSNWTLFWLKSSDIDLYDYTGQVSIKWTVVDILEKKPLIKVTEIIENQGKQDIQKLTANPSFSYFKNAGLWLDLSISQWFEVEQQWWEIVLLDTQSENQIQTVLSIAPFQCTPGDSLRDCETLKKNFYDLNSETFTSDSWITFFNLTETNTRLMFDNNERWYYVKPRDKDKLISFVDMIHFLDNETIKNELIEETLTTCKTLEHRLWDSSNVTLSMQNDWLLTWKVSGPTLDDSWVLITCTYLIKPGTSREFQLLSVVSWDADWFKLLPFEWTPAIEKTDLPVEELQQVVPAQEEKKEPTPTPPEEKKEDPLPEENEAWTTVTWAELSNTDALKNAIDSIVADTEENLWEWSENPTKAPANGEAWTNSEESVDPSFIDAPQEKPAWTTALTFEEIQKIEKWEAVEARDIKPEPADTIDDSGQEIQDNTVKEEEKTAPTPPTPKDSRYEWRLGFESVRGYTTFFWDNKIAYSGQYVADDKKLSIDGADCSYGVHIINRSNTSKVVETPDSIIYECNWTINKASLPNDTTYITEFNGKHFIKKDFTSAFAGMEVGIE